MSRQKEWATVVALLEDGHGEREEGVGAWDGLISDAMQLLSVWPAVVSRGEGVLSGPLAWLQVVTCCAWMCVHCVLLLAIALHDGGGGAC